MQAISARGESVRMCACGRNFLDGGHGCAGRAPVQPLAQLIDRCAVAAGAHFNAAVDHVDCMPCQLQRDRNVASACPEKYALNAAADFELTAHDLEPVLVGFRVAGWPDSTLRRLPAPTLPSPWPRPRLHAPVHNPCGKGF